MCAVVSENNALRDDVSQLKGENTFLKEELAELKEQVAWFKKQLYGQKSEKTEIVLEGVEQITMSAEQLPMFDEAEQEADTHPKEMETTDVKGHKRKKKSTHDEIFGNLNVKEVLHKVENKTCDKCGSEMTVIGKEKIRDEVVYVPARVFVRRHVTEVVKCTICGMDESRDADLPDIEKCYIRTAEVPAPMIPHSFCTPELLAHVTYEKYCNPMQLNRLEKDFAAKGIRLSRTTMANWIIYAAETWLKPIWEQMRKELRTSHVIHADETVVQVLNEPGKKAKTDSRMWVYCNGKLNDHSNILFDYQPTRNGDHAVRFLGDYHGYIVCDGFDAYNQLKNSTRCGCSVTQ